MSAKTEDATMTVDEAVNKPMVYWDDHEGVEGKYIYRASALMSCQNALLLARLGVDGHAPPKKMQERYDEGHEQEALILRKLDKDFGFKCYGHQQTMELAAGRTALIRGHIDAMSLMDMARVTSVNGTECVVGTLVKDFIGEGKIAIIDGKALAPSTFDIWVSKGFEGFLYYLWQQAVYLYAGDWDAIVMAVKQKVTGEVRVDLFTRKWFEERLPKATLLQRVLWVESKSKDPEFLFKLPCSPAMYPCPYYDQHPGATEVRAESDVDRVELRRVVDMRQTLKATMESAKAEIELIDGDLRSMFANKPTEKPVKLDDWTVSTYYSGSAVTHWSEIAKALNMSVDEVKKQFTGTQKSTKLSVKVAAKSGGK